MSLHDLTDKELDLFKNVIKEFPKLKCPEFLDLLKKEELRRTQIELSGEEIISNYLLKYIRFDFADGLGSYEVWKVGRIDDYGNKTYSLYPDKSIPVISNFDGDYEIETFLEDLQIFTTDDLKKITVISKEEYDKEFDNAINYYRSLKKE